MNNNLIEKGVRVSDDKMYQENKIWSRYSQDKVDIGEELMKVIRVLDKELPLSKKMSALSIGSSNEPQFRILETAFRGGLYLIDIEKEALKVVRERIHRQRTGHVSTICADYKKIFLNAKDTERFFKAKLKRKKMELITLHHSMYYCEKCDWETMFENLYRKILAPKGAIHAVLMAPKSSDPYTTAWFYNHFAGKFFGCRNDQDLHAFGKRLMKNPLFRNTRISLRTNRVRFFVNDFEKLMAVAWMVLLYPNVHKYTLKQKREITEFIYNKFWIKKRPLVQLQDHLVVYRGIGLRP